MREGNSAVNYWLWLLAFLGPLTVGFNISHNYGKYERNKYPMDEQMIKKINKLIATTKNIIVCSVDEQGYPNSKAMFKVVHEGLKTFYLSTNTSSMRVGQYLKNPKACLYFYSRIKIHGLMLVGEIEVLTDNETKRRFWRPFWKIYYPKGVTDPDYCILKFTAKSGNYYCALQKHLFNIE
jgi:general stress protein 26